MRLTLRTMLAYMDGILEPEDAEDIAKKIEESEFAMNLLHRARDAMRRLRLAAPGLADREPGLDANTVAEYLDNALQHGRVPDFEKICLDSEIHLAEVASCHQILALVLGEAAEIDPAARQRMYQLPAPQAVDAASQSSSGNGPRDDSAGRGASEPELSPSGPVRPRPTVPDYLREPRKRGRFSAIAAAAALVLAACGAVVGLALSGQLARDSRLFTLFLGPASTEMASDPGPGTSAPEPPTVAPGPPEKPPSDGAPTQTGPSGGSDSPPDIPEPPRVGDPSATAALPDRPEPLGEPAASDTPAADTAATETPAGDTPDVRTPPPRAEPSPPSPMGRLMSDDEVLLRFDPDPESAGWQRVAPEGFLVSGQSLLALPTYRPKLTLSTVMLQLLGGTQIVLLPSNEQGLVGLRVSFGRVLLSPLAEAGTRLRLEVGGRTGEITFVDAESMLAVEVTPVRIPGTNPETVDALTLGRLYARTGQIRWVEEAAPETISLEPQTCLVIDDRPAVAAAAVKELPPWITADAAQTNGYLDRRASVTVEEALRLDRSAALGLLELTDHRQKEVVWLATRCLAHVGQFDRMVAVLNDPSHKPDWPDYVEELRLAISRGTDSANSVRLVMEREYGTEAAAAYRMLWGYTNEDLQGGEDRAGEDRMLVEHLEHETLALRRLSFWNLEQITGVRLLYRPEETAAKRKTPVQKWNQRLEAGQIRFKSPEQSGPPPDQKASPRARTGPQP